MSDTGGAEAVGGDPQAADGMRTTLRIAHIVTFVSADGAFGGPVAVAMAQTAELARLGHEVHLVAGWDGRATVTTPAVRVHLFRAATLLRGRLASVVSLRLLKHLVLHRRRYDVAHLHFGRDLSSLLSWLTLRASGARLILQPHGMVMPDDRLAVRILDALICRPALRSAHEVLVLTEVEQTGINSIARGGAQIRRIGNGLALDAAYNPTRLDQTVLFLARLHPRKRVLNFAAAAALVLRHHPSARFRIIGPDEGDLNALLAYIAEEELEDRVEYGGTVLPGHSRDELIRAAVYVLPSVREVYPVSVLEAMAVGTPVVLTEDNGLALMLREADAAVVTGESIEALASGITELLDVPGRRQAIAAHAADLIKGPLSIKRVGEVLEASYGDGRQGVLGGPGDRMTRSLQESEE